MDTASELLLLLLAIVMFTQARDGKLGDWLRAKFFNAAEPTRPRTGGWFGGVLDQAAKEAAKTGPGATATIAMASPLNGPIVSGFGPRKSPGGIGSTNHKGIDIDGPAGAPVRAAAPGKVIAAGSAGGYGLRVDIDHGAGVVTRYAHMRRITVTRGQQVGTGTQLGEVGSTGTATGDHLHFEVRVNGTAVNPSPYLSGGLLSGAVGA